MRIAFLGDIALIGRYDRTISADVDKRIETVKRLVKDCDYVIANLESPLTSLQKTITCKGVYLKSNPMNVRTLLEMGITHVSLANNHIFDYGKKGAAETISVLKKHGIRYVGLNNSPSVLKKGNSIAFLDGFCCLSTNGLRYGENRGQVKILSKSTLNTFLEYVDNQGGLPIASVHFGVEGLHYPSREHIAFFRKAGDDYNYILHGNHPHAIQGYEKYNNSLLIYAQGNLCFDVATVTSFHEQPVEGVEERKHYIAIVDIQNNSIISNTVIPTTDLETGIIHEDKEILEELIQYSSALNLPISEIENLRIEEMKKLRVSTQAHNLQFFLNRLNYKYIGAYLNGKRHSKQYKKIMMSYLKL